MSSRITSRRVPGAVASAVALRLPWAVAEDVAGPGLGLGLRLRWLGLGFGFGFGFGSGVRVRGLG